MSINLYGAHETSFCLERQNGVVVLYVGHWHSASGTASNFQWRLVCDDGTDISSGPPTTKSFLGYYPRTCLGVESTVCNGRNGYLEVNTGANPSGSAICTIGFRDSGPVLDAVCHPAVSPGGEVFETGFQFTDPIPGALEIDPVTGDDYVNNMEDNGVVVTGTGGTVGNTIAVTLTDQNGVEIGPFPATINSDGSWQLNNPEDITSLAEGPVTATATQTDGSGLTSDPTTRVFTYDRTVPNPTIDIIEVNDIINAAEAPDVTITGTSEPTSTVYVTITDQNGNTVGPLPATVTGGTWVLQPDVDLTGLVDGPITVTATETDQAGNTATTTRMALKDTTAPNPPVIYTPIEDDDIANLDESTDVELCGSADPTSTIDLVLTDDCSNTVTIPPFTPNSSGEWCITIPENDFNTLCDGTITITGTETDPNGNTSPPATEQFLKDVVPPVVSCATTTINIGANADGTYTLVESDVVASAPTDLNGIQSYTFDNNTYTCSDVGNTYSDVDHTAIDTAGNVASCFATINVVDTTAPVVQCHDYTFDFNSGDSSDGTYSPSPLITATDSCPGSITYTSSQSTFTVVDTGVTTVTSTATDIYGNTATCTSTVTIGGDLFTIPGLQTNGEPNSVAVDCELYVPFTIEWYPLDMFAGMTVRIFLSDEHGVEVLQLVNGYSYDSYSFTYHGLHEIMPYRNYFITIDVLESTQDNSAIPIAIYTVTGNEDFMDN